MLNECPAPEVLRGGQLMRRRSCLHRRTPLILRPGLHSAPGFHDVRSISVPVGVGGGQSLFLVPFPLGQKEEPAAEG